MAKAKRQPDIEKIIQRAVEAGRAAGRKQTEDTYKATERRLYALPVLIKKVEDAKERLEEVV